MHGVWRSILSVGSSYAISSGIRSLVFLFICLLTTLLIPYAYSDERQASAGLEDPDVPLPPHASKIVSPWTEGISDMKGGVTSLQGDVLSFKDAIADLIGSLKGWTLIDEDGFYLVRMDSDVLFDFDSAALRSEAKDNLGRFAEVLATYEKKELSITGHTDSKGTDQYNDKLSQRRAEAVKGFLSETKPLAGWRYVVKGRGEREPISPNQTADGRDDPVGRQKNRRVELRIPKVKA